LSVRNLRLDGDVASANGGVALVVPDGDLTQTAGEISGRTVALQVGGNTGTFDENAPASATEIAIDAGALVLDVGGDVVLNQADGNLRFETQAVIGGETYTTTGAGDDLRVRVGSGDITVNADLTSGGDLGLVTGSTSVVAQTFPGNIILNGNIKADGNDLVLIASGNIIHQSGTITSARLGLGANGSIGTAAAPLNIEADDLAVNPFGASVNDPTGFQTVGSVTATGLSVNQGAPPPPAPPEPEPPAPVPAPPEVGPIPNPTSEPLIPEVIAEEVGRNEEILLVQNQVDLVENVLELLIDTNQELIEPDPTRLPFPVTDDDFLRKKFRR
ncbi:MAG: hypothetical protein KC800_22855, partial [Candidatus Eremiobacteraeota bacterium]|nr:hypothetical protein [Candidatus Eremiobacteraeota bacterium]